MDFLKDYQFISTAKKKKKVTKKKKLTLEELEAETKGVLKGKEKVKKGLKFVIIPYFNQCQCGNLFLFP